MYVRRGDYGILTRRLTGKYAGGDTELAVVERERTGSFFAPPRTVAPRWHRPAMTVAQVVLEAICILCAFGAAYWARYERELGGAVEAFNRQPITVYTSYALLLTAAILVACGVRGLYRLPRGTTFVSEGAMVAGAVTVANAAVLVVVFLSPDLVSSRLFVIFAWMAIIAALVLERGILRVVRDQLWQRGIGVDRALVVGMGQAAERMMSYIAARNDLGLYLVGFVDESAAPEDWIIATSQKIIHPVYLGTPDDLPDVIRREGVSEVIIALPPQAHEQIAQVIATCRMTDVHFQLVPDVFELSLGRVEINELNGVPLLAMRKRRISGWNLGVKRVVDVVGAIAALAILGIPMLLIALAIRLDTRGPAIIKQIRAGKDSKPFTCYKFRSMVHNAAALQADMVAQSSVEPTLVKFKNDKRRTRVGRVLRKTSLDELPQLFNVLIGKMSLVGPRPQVMAEVAHYEPWHRQRLTVTPGMTGIWQVAGRSDLTFDEMVRLDIYYAEHWSVRLDLEILLRTIPAVLTQRGAY